MDGQAVIGERVKVPQVALDRALVVRRAADEADAPAAVHLDQVAHRPVHALPVVHADDGGRTERLLHADDGQRGEPAAELLHAPVTDVDPECARPDDQPVERLRGNQVVDRVGVPAEPRPLE
jgi:hypothetical protein